MLHPYDKLNTFYQFLQRNTHKREERKCASNLENQMRIEIYYLQHVYSQ